MKTGNQETAQNLLNRLKRIEGQVRGVQNMIEGERECREILQQLVAIRSAVNSATLTFMQDYVSDCLLNYEGEDQVRHKEALREAIQLLSKVQ